MDYISAFIEFFTGEWSDNNSKSSWNITPPNRNHARPHSFLGKSLYTLLLLIGGSLFGLLIAYLNHFYDITGFFLFFIIPIGAIVLGLVANIGLVAVLAFLRMKGINYSKLCVALISGIIALSSFWLSQYIVYLTGTITVNYISRKPPIELKQGLIEVKQIEDTLHGLYSSIEKSSNKLKKIKSEIKKMEQNAGLGFFIDKQEYKRYKTLISQYNRLVIKHNTTVEKAQKIHERYETKLRKVNALIDKFNRGEIGEKVIKAKKEPICNNYTFLDYIQRKYERQSFKMFGHVANIPIATPSEDLELGSLGLILLLLKQFGLFFAFPILWWWNRSRR